MPQRGFRYRTFSYSSYFPPGVKWLIITNVAVFLICYLGGYTVQYHVRGVLALSANAAIRTFMIWQVFTYMFVHFGLVHCLFNMLFLWMCGLPIEQAWGTRRFVKFYLLCGTAAGCCVLVVNMLVGDWATPTIGASGAVFGLLVAFGILFPDSIILLFLIFPMRAKYAVMILVAVELLTTFGPNTGVSTIAHLGGAAFGYVYLKSGWSSRIASSKRRLPDLRGAYRQWKLQRAKRKFQVYMRKHGGGGPWVN